MAGFGKVENDELKRMQAKFEKMVAPEEVGKVYDAALKEVGRVHLANCIRNTPFGMYSSQVSFIAYKGTPKEKVVSFTVGKKLGGTLKKGWVVTSHMAAELAPGNPSAAEISDKVKSTRIYKSGKNRQMTFFNHVNYSVYVDKGHRICRPAGKQIGWVKPQNFIRNAENETSRVMPSIIKRHMTDYLKEIKP